MNIRDGVGAAVINFPNTGATPYFFIRSDDDPGTWEAANERLFINGVSGNVGIGTTAPGARLDVQGGAIKASGGFILPTAAPVPGQMWIQ